MFSVKQKRLIAEAVENILRDTKHAELPGDFDEPISFTLLVEGTESWSYAEIKNNSAVLVPDVNVHNEFMDKG
jgi:hypothetical protein